MKVSKHFELSPRMLTIFQEIFYHDVFKTGVKKVGESCVIFMRKIGLQIVVVRLFDCCTDSEGYHGQSVGEKSVRLFSEIFLNI